MLLAHARRARCASASSPRGRARGRGRRAPAAGAIGPNGVDARRRADTADDDEDDDAGANAYARMLGACHRDAATRAAMRGLEENRRALDCECVCAMAYAGAGRGRLATTAEVARIGGISARWRMRVGTKLSAVKASVLAGGEERAAVRAVAMELASAQKALLGATRTFTFEAMLEEEAYILQRRRETREDGDVDGGGDGDDVRIGALVRMSQEASAIAGVEDIPQEWRMACANVGAYLDFVGAKPTFEEWKRLRVLFASIVTHLSGEKARIKMIDDDIGWRAIKAMMDDSTVRPKRLAQMENNARYRAATEELEEAKKQWKEATRTYKEARQRIKQARQRVHTTRKAVRIEYR